MLQKPASYGARLREARHSVDMTMKQLHEAVARRTGGARGSTIGGLRYYEAGQVGRPSREIIEACAAVLGVSTQWLLSGEGARDPTNAEALAELDRAEEERERLADEAADRELIAALRRGEVEQERKMLAERGVMDSELLESPTVRVAFRTGWSRLIEGCEDRNVSPVQKNAIGRLLLAQLRAPLEAWGYRHDLDPAVRDFEDYALAMLHALMLAMPPSGRGDPATGLASPPYSSEKSNGGAADSVAQARRTDLATG